MRNRTGWAAVLALSMIMVCGGTRAQGVCKAPIGFVTSVQGQVEVRKAGIGAWTPAGLSEPLCAGDVIRVGHRSRALASITGQPTVRIDQNTTLRLVGAPKEQPFMFQFMQGAAYFFSRRPRTLSIDTPFVTAGVRGTEFLVRAEKSQSLITVFEGEVDARNAQGGTTVAAGETVVARAGEAPVPYILAKPHDSVQWALFYPVILLPLADRSGAAAQTAPTALRAAVDAAARNNFPQAFAQFDRIDAVDRDAAFFVYRAATLLNVGRVEEARAAIELALAEDPQNGEAYALRAVIAVTRNEKAKALTDAERAVSLSPRSAAAKMALSYAQQAQFDLMGARQTLEQAVADEPDNALAWARLSELWLMLGQRRRALKKAEKARDLAPQLERTQTVFGYALLTEIQVRQAREAFAQAIALDPANPLPRFGLGLAKIRQGRLSEGRGDIESAVALDPDNALLRSYLGKAYFEERTTSVNEYFTQLLARLTGEEKPSLAGQQFAIAKDLDPNDPTPWFYDAIRKQSENRPVEALRDLERSIELNDNRAVYRSRQLLDEDRAARGVSQARIYNDLGFEQLGINEATKSLSVDPSNAAAHRFLSDVYATQPRREIARVSELLQAQLLQDININPVQPSLSETNLNIYTDGGPSRPGFNEFTPLFERNQAQLNLSGEVGSQYTRAGEAVVSGVYDRFSVSAGQFHYKTDGFRDNFDLRHDIGNFYLQGAATPDLNIQTEIIVRRSEYGDRRLNFELNDPDLFIPDSRFDLDQDIVRIGARYAPNINSTVIGSAILGKRHEKVEVTSPPVFVEGNNKDKGYQGEGQYILRTDRINGNIGFGVYDVDRSLRRRTEFMAVPIPTTDNTTHINIDHRTPYTYWNLEFPQRVVWSVGLSYDRYDQPGLSISKVNPKLGFRWFPWANMRLRAAAFRTIKPPLIADRTIQPTQVAGFNQFFDDANGTEAWLYGAGLDLRLTRDFFAGLEVSRRSYDEPVLQGANPAGKIATDSRDEDFSRVYLNWMPHANWSLIGEVRYDKFKSNPKINVTVPESVRTWSVPISIRYFTGNGFFAGIRGTFVNQNVSNPNRNSTGEGDDSYYIVDTSIGYRLPERRGLFSVDILNIFDTNLKCQDDSFREFRDAFSSPAAAGGCFIPERSIVGRFTFNF